MVLIIIIIYRLSFYDGLCLGATHVSYEVWDADGCWWSAHWWTCQARWWFLWWIMSRCNTCVIWGLRCRWLLMVGTLVDMSGALMVFMMDYVYVQHMSNMHIFFCNIFLCFIIVIITTYKSRVVNMFIYTFCL